MLDDLTTQRFQLIDVKSKSVRELAVRQIVFEALVGFANQWNLRNVDQAAAFVTLGGVMPSSEKILHEMIEFAKSRKASKVPQIHRLATGLVVHKNETGN